MTGATVALNQDGSIAVRLPDGRILDYGDQTTVKVTLRTNNMPVPDKAITVTDRGGNFAGGVTGKAGTVTVPANTNQSGDSGKSTVGRDDADDNDYTLTVRVVDAETGRPIEGAKVTIGKTGNITVVLPDGIDMDPNNRITVVVTDNKGDPQEVNVIVRNDLGNTATGKTNGAGTITVPASDTTERHSVYILGYPDGSFGPERTMTRCEAATIFARILSDKLGESVPTTAETIYKDIPANAWYSGYVKYLTDYGVVKGDNYGKFRPYDDITRNEYTAMAVRFFEICGDASAVTEQQYTAFQDLSADSWAAVYVDIAAMRGWVNGYTDGTFRGGNSITRAEAVTITNRMLGRAADQAYIDQNIRKLNTFVDMPKTHWAYYQVMEAANAHTADLTGAETWSK